MSKGTTYGRTMQSQALSTNGDGTGTVNANVDGGTPVAFKLTCPAGVHYEVARLIVYIEDTGNLLAANYGALGVLTNGVLVEVHDASGNPTGQLGHTLKSNSHWAKVCHDSSAHDYGSGNNAVSVRWTFQAAGESINLMPSESLVVTIQDDLQGLVEHSFIAQFVQVR